VILRRATVEDLAFLGAMIREAAFRPDRLPPLAEALLVPRVAQWLDGWMREGDIGVVAGDDDGTRTGAAWCRLFDGDSHPNPGFVDPQAPIVAIAVVDGRRGAGIGGALLDALADAARADGRRALSLAVGRSNPARRLYARAGYVELDDPPDQLLRMRLALQSPGS
jgi:GNAT superfamily N-acetyltransferase